MAGGFGSMIAKLKMSPKTIVFPEGKDERILEAASRLLSSNFLHPILVGKEEEIFAASEVAGRAGRSAGACGDCERSVHIGPVYRAAADP